MINQLGGTKFTGFIIVVSMGFTLMLVKDLKTATDFMTYAFGFFGIYVAGNVGATVVNNLKK